MKIMQNLFKITMLLALVSILATSCKKDLTDDMDDNATENTEQSIQSNSTNFMTGGDTDGDGDFDELCFEFVYPVTIILPDGTNQTAMNDDELFTIIDDFYIANPDSDEDPTFEFPIDVILEDSTTQTLNNEEELEVLFENCFDEWDDEDGEYDEECFTLNFPVTVVYSDGTTATANSEEELETLFEEWEMNNPDAEEYPTLQLPVEVTLEDGTVESIGTEEELEELFEECYDDWDDEDGEWEECFEFVYPVNVLLPDGTSQAANDDEELEEIIFTWYENNPDDSIGYPTLEFPVNVDLDGEIITVNSEEELEELFEECDDDDHEGNPFEECFTISYPITIVFPDSTTADVNSNEELEMTIDNWYDQNPDSDDDPTLVYPIEVTLMEDGSVVTVNDDDELEEIIEECFGCFFGDTNNMVAGNDKAILTAMTIKQHQTLKNKTNGKIAKKLKK